MGAEVRRQRTRAGGAGGAERLLERGSRGGDGSGVRADDAHAREPAGVVRVPVRLRLRANRRVVPGEVRDVGEVRGGGRPGARRRAEAREIQAERRARVVEGARRERERHQRGRGGDAGDRRAQTTAVARTRGRSARSHHDARVHCESRGGGGRSGRARGMFGTRSGAKPPGCWKNRARATRASAPRAGGGRRATRTQAQPLRVSSRAGRHGEASRSPAPRARCRNGARRTSRRGKCGLLHCGENNHGAIERERPSGSNDQAVSKNGNWTKHVTEMHT